MAETNDNALPESPAQAFKEAMRRLAATVTIVTAAKGDESYGMTMTAVTSLSMDPPSLVICVNRNASLHPVLAGRQEAPFCVNLLHHDHQDAATAFAGAAERTDRFATGSWEYDESGTPYLADAQASLFCTCLLYTSPSPRD